jgi:hypothetical protein
MTTVVNLLARKQMLLERLQENPGPRDEIERLLRQIDTALDLLDQTGPRETRDEQKGRRGTYRCLARKPPPGLRSCDGFQKGGP